MEHEEIARRVGDLIDEWYEMVHEEEELRYWTPYLRDLTSAFLRSFDIVVGEPGVEIALYREVRDRDVGDYVDLMVEIQKYYEISGNGFHVSLGLIAMWEGCFHDGEYKAEIFFGELGKIADRVRVLLPLLDASIEGIDVGGMGARP